MKNQKSKIAERIRKLFAPGESSNQHEAELAMQKASELMKEYQISMVDVDLSEDGAILKEDYNVDADFRLGKSVFNLVIAAARLYDGQASRYVSSSSRKTGLKFVFYGTPADVNAMKMTFAHLYDSWKSIIKHDFEVARQNDPMVNPQSFKRAHLYGYAQELRNRAFKLAQERNKEVKSATGRDLIVVKSKAVDDYMSKIKFRTCSGTSPIDSAGYNAGCERGNNASFGGISNEKTLMVGRK